MKRTVSKNHITTAAKVTAELNVRHEDPFSTKTVRRGLHKSNIHRTTAIAKQQSTENNAKRQKRWCDDHKAWKSDDWKYVIRSDELPFTLFPASGRDCVCTTPKEAYNADCLVQLWNMVADL